ncbi:hypothetical protein GF391_02920 [Candidatus Uhrbacteria bacterium]|nr:hypothetical protein [Candidatus Uhrbacteria bacterium]
MNFPDQPTIPKNPFEAPPNEPSSAKERIERFIDTRLNQLLEQQCQKVNEGNNGAILKLHIEDVPEDLLEVLKEAGIAIETDQAVKVLKFYAMGRGEAEFEMQRKAQEIVAKYDGDQPMAKIPKVHMYRDLPILLAVREKLKSIGIKNNCQLLYPSLFSYIFYKSH